MGHVPFNSYWVKRDVSHLLDVSHLSIIVDIPGGIII